MAPCNHQTTQIRQKPTSNGQIRFAAQCLTCGGTVGKSAIGRLEVLERCGTTVVPNWDNELQARYWHERAQLSQAEWRAKRDQENIDWWRNYTAYLETPEWRRKSRLVIQRDGFCRGCGVNPATQAHHLTYRHVGNEFLFELVGVCRSCHERLHEGRQF